MKHCHQQLQREGIAYERVEAIYGNDLQFPLPAYSDRGYRLRQGRHRIAAEVGCFMSHLKALKAFLNSDADWGLILEDDISLPAQLRSLIDRSLAVGGFDILRLSTVNSGRWLPVTALDDTYHLGVAVTREKGAGAYLVNRRAAETMLRRYLPMNLPYDHRFDLEWLDGLTAAGISPAPVRQGGFATQIQSGVRRSYIHPLLRYWTVLPFRTFWEVSRFFCRSIQWVRLWARSRARVPHVGESVPPTPDRGEAASSRAA